MALETNSLHKALKISQEIGSKKFETWPEKYSSVLIWRLWIKINALLQWQICWPPWPFSNHANQPLIFYLLVFYMVKATEIVRFIGSWNIIELDAANWPLVFVPTLWVIQLVSLHCSYPGKCFIHFKQSFNCFCLHHPLQPRHSQSQLPVAEDNSAKFSLVPLVNNFSLWLLVPRTDYI